MKTDRNNDKGSVLMEFIIVAPLYLLLLGGMMLIGELITAQMRLMEHDRTLAWLADDRHFSSSEEVNRIVEIAKKSFDLPDIAIDQDGNSIIKRDHYSFENDYIKDESEWVTASVNSEGDKHVLGNFWARLYNSQMQLKMTAIPASIRGPMSILGLLTGDTSYIPDEIDFYRGGKDTTERDNDRHYVVHRFLYQDNYAGYAASLYNRNLSAAELVKSSVVWNVIDEPWIQSENTRIASVSQPGNSQGNQQDDYGSYDQRLYGLPWSE